MSFRWYNPATWRMFGYTDPTTGDYVEVETTVGGRRTKAGVVVTPKSSLSVPIIWSCMRVLVGTTAGLPLKLFDDLPSGRVIVPADRRPARLLRKPNPRMTRLNFLKPTILNLALRGNAYAVIDRAKNGDWIGLVPTCADDVEPDKDAEGDLFYWVMYEGKRTPVSPENMLHFKLFSSDGIVGLSPVEHLADTIGQAKAAQDWASRFMRKGGVTGGYVIYEKFLTKEQQAQILEKFPDIRKDDVNSLGSWGLLQGNPKIVPAGLTQKDAQFIETQQFTEEALAGIWGVPLHLANRASKTSIQGSNVEQTTSGFVTFGLKPYLDAIEDELNDKLFGGTTMFVEFVVEGLLRADSAARAAYYQIALGGNNNPGWMSQDEVREKENMPRLGGDYSKLTRWEARSNADKTGSAV
ncbi:phage portal protein [Pigmentiphaga litoralis]|uniref:phage portal protein n=1 Tax=Pigmentiphaga litoralis TaxID=516702 RepID=UPI001679427E|nr:phage portal protein [Pigmentiphaga litoralis]GGX11198.1 phage portal protein [Pigmentiphaga litoralis]